MSGEIIFFPGWLAGCAALAAVLALPLGQEVIFSGIPLSQLMGVPDLLQVGKWTALCCIPLMASGVILERSRQIGLFSLLRVKKRSILRRREALACGACTAGWAGGVFLVAVWRLGLAQAGEILALLLPNLLLWSGVGLVSDALTRRAAWSGVVPLALLGGCCILEGRFPALAPFLPSTWGMTCQATPGMALASLAGAGVCYFIFIRYEEGNYGTHRN